MVRLQLRDIIFSTFFKDEKKTIEKDDIYLDAARKAAQLFYSSTPRMSRTQLRSFLRYLRGLEIPLRFPTRPQFETIVPQLNELYAFTVYQTYREKPSYSIIFKEFFESYLPLIRSDEREFNIFVKFISSIIAYSTEIDSRERAERRTRRH